MAFSADIARRLFTRGWRQVAPAGKCARVAARVAAVACLFFAILPASPPLHAADREVRDAVRAQIASLREYGRLGRVDAGVSAAGAVAGFYERRGFEPAWESTGDIESLADAIRSSYHEGLRPTDYRLTRIEQELQAVRSGRQRSDDQQAALDILLTDSLIRLVNDLRQGKVIHQPLTTRWVFDARAGATEPAPFIEDILAADSIGDAIAAGIARGLRYQRLKAQLRRHRILADAGGWPLLPEGPTIHPGSGDPRLPALRERLTLSGDLQDAGSSSAVYDDALQAAVRRFQTRHGLEPDALLGPGTLRALNVPIEQRIDQIRLNLERARWVSDAQGADFILVNIAGFAAYVVRRGETVWTTSVVVGETEKQTPVFRSTMKQVVFNPTWTVPRSIATEELLPKIQRNPGFLARGNYVVLDANGKHVDAAGIDWRVLSTDNFPFTLVQQPGPSNQLGRIKFVFPNDYSVYMHDTPARHLFDEARRAFSHGCVRVDKPLALAEAVLAADGWTRERIEAQVESGETRSVRLSRPLPMLVLYWTAVVDDRGTIHFYEDIYKRDAAVVAALDRPVPGVAYRPD